jgi:hypothetical protein
MTTGSIQPTATASWGSLGRFFSHETFDLNVMRQIAEFDRLGTVRLVGLERAYQKVSAVVQERALFTSSSVQALDGKRKHPSSSVEGQSGVKRAQGSAGASRTKIFDSLPLSKLVAEAAKVEDVQFFEVAMDRLKTEVDVKRFAFQNLIVEFKRREKNIPKSDSDTFSFAIPGQSSNPSREPTLIGFKFALMGLSANPSYSYPATDAAGFEWIKQFGKSLAEALIAKALTETEGSEKGAFNLLLKLLKTPSNYFVNEFFRYSLQDALESAIKRADRDTVCLLVDPGIIGWLKMWPDDEDLEEILSAPLENPDLEAVLSAALERVAAPSFPEDRAFE